MNEINRKLKGGRINMNAKITGIFMVFLLATSLFAGIGFAADEAVDSTTVVEDDFNEEDLKEALDGVDEDNKEEDKRKVGFAKVWRGLGSMENGEEGFLVNSLWAVQRFAEVTDEGNIEQETV